MKWSGTVLFSTRRGWGVSAAALLLGALSWVAPMAPVAAQSPSIVVASTTSTEQSGLFGHILPEFTQASGIAVKVVALGTGQAIDMARRGDADVLFVHDQVAEEKVIAAHESLAYGIAHEVRQVVFAEDIKHWKVSGG